MYAYIFIQFKSLLNEYVGLIGSFSPSMIRVNNILSDYYLGQMID